MKKSLIFIHTLLLVFTVLNCKAQEVNDKIQLIIDADTANEVDDLFALVRAINEPKFNLLGITSAQFHTSPLASDSTVYESQKINEELVQLLNHEEIVLPLGSNHPLKNISSPAQSEAADFIIKKAHELKEGQKLQVVILGPCTNLASAILKDPSIIPKIQAHYIGFWHNTTTNTYDKKEFNTNNDPLAVDVLLNAPKLDFSVMTATTSQHLVFSKKEVDQYLKGKGGISDLLVNRWETYDRWWTKEDPEKQKWIMWDLAIIEALIHTELAEKTTFITPKENLQRPITIYTKIAVAKMKADFWTSIKKYQINKN
ncbi:nucleoside hydrolase [Aurantibacter crassamenti]|uniref:nucleoside hydrolase n=1 Tax=Aurantibacter crassamenti TaxID=1837375 RepID=UPI00193A3D0C|nr:nucleoside hydrolase [Aurantibacter crassamenti]MBM1104701.1 nucleoside hydrolase [Aurantibacter crassamenti]